MLIGLCGVAGAGKTEVGSVLIREANFNRVKFADPLKNMIRTMLRDIGHTDEDVERYVEGDLKESVVDGIGVTARHLMQTLGTEWGRKQAAEDLWLRLWAGKAERFDRVVVDDIRFSNEVEMIRSRGGEVWQIVRPGAAPQAGVSHISERLEVSADRVIVNDGDLDQLHARVRHAWVSVPGNAFNHGYDHQSDVPVAAE